MKRKAADEALLERYEVALQQVYNALGPDAGCPDNKCEGCRFEMREALNVAINALAERLVPYRRHEPKLRYSVNASCYKVAPSGTWAYISDGGSQFAIAVRGGMDEARRIAAVLNAREPK